MNPARSSPAVAFVWADDTVSAEVEAWLERRPRRVAASRTQVAAFIASRAPGSGAPRGRRR